MAQSRLMTAQRKIPHFSEIAYREYSEFPRRWKNFDFRPLPELYTRALDNGQSLDPFHGGFGKTKLPRMRFQLTPRCFYRPAFIRRSPVSASHSNIGITLDLYSHVTPVMRADAAEQVDAAIRKAIKASE
jgi:hypothetical protein